MEIDKAISYLTWEAKKDKEINKLTPKKLEAINAVISYVNWERKKLLSEHDLFAKMFIEKFIMLCETKHHTAKSALEEISRILNHSVYDLVKILQDKMPMFKFNSIGQDTEPLDMAKFDNITYLRERSSRIVAQHTAELSEALKTSYNESEVIHFVEKSINKFITEHKTR